MVLGFRSREAGTRGAWSVPAVGVDAVGIGKGEMRVLFFWWFADGDEKSGGVALLEPCTVPFSGHSHAGIRSGVCCWEEESRPGRPRRMGYFILISIAQEIGGGCWEMVFQA
ncbi:hypothetical protein RJT34_12370 [Clitoria ternatea]|uniref:Uncharacterized protein n=1 Tax=Clitoria ternatea TaxID=43366 RepID=A0AAN9PJ95_CLITE